MVVKIVYSIVLRTRRESGKDSTARWGEDRGWWETMFGPNIVVIVIKRSDALDAFDSSHRLQVRPYRLQE